jgi:RimJ/RimL family protein N-acetyltransferase
MNQCVNETGSTVDVLLRDVLESDLPEFFEMQLNPKANHMAAFTAKNPGDGEAFYSHWSDLLANEAVTKRTIVFEDRIVGNLCCFSRDSDQEISYWIRTEYWGKGIATRALQLLLSEVATRPLFARVAKDNLGSIRVLEKCGFKVVGSNKFFANARGAEIEEAILKLDNP